MASGFATLRPRSDGAVPCGASAITTVGRYSASRAKRSDSAPAIDPKSCSTMSDSRSPSRLRAGTTRASPSCEMSIAYVASIRMGL